MSNDTKKPVYWRSFEELAQTEDWQTLASQEFEHGASVEPMSGQTRRHFLGVMGASMAMTGLAGCVRRPEETIMPYTNMPEHVLPGVPSHYATSTHIGGDVIGLLIESNDGRPTKVEGNPVHPSSRGALTEGSGGTGTAHQAMILELYDPQRLRYPSKDGKLPITWEAVSAKVAALATAVTKSGGKGTVILSEANPSPTLARVRGEMLGRAGRSGGSIPQAKWYTFEPISYDNQREGLSYAFGSPMRAIPHLANARFIMSIGSDFLGTEHGSVAASADWARNRSVGEVQSGKDKAGNETWTNATLNVNMNRLYVAESVMSLTGSNADHRVRLTSAQMDAYGAQVASAMEEINGVKIPADLKASIQTKLKTKLPEQAIKMARAFAMDIQNTVLEDGEGAAILVGRSQSPFLHNLAAFLNHPNTTKLYPCVRYYPDFARPKFVARGEEDKGDFGNLKALTDALNNGQVENLIILGGNPVYHAPTELGFAAAMKKAKNVIVLSDQATETTRLASLTIPRAHFLEAWGDTTSSTADSAIQQPIIHPLHGAWSDLELLLRLQGAKPDGYEAVRTTWMARFDEKEEGKEDHWARCLADGLNTLDKDRPAALDQKQLYLGIGALAKASTSLVEPTQDSLDLIILPDPNIGDGRFATNSILQEAPDPLTKVCWDNTLLMSPATASALKIEKPSQIGHTATERVELTAKVNGKEVTLDMPVWILPGMADNTLAVYLGYGREFDSYLPYHDAGVIGVSVVPFRTVGSPDLIQGVKVKKTARMYPIACVQRYGSQTESDAPNAKRRPLVRETTVDDFKLNPEFAKEGIIHHGHYPEKTVGKGTNQKKVDFLVAHPPAKALHDAPAIGADYSRGYQWAMVIDLNKCTGCNSCLVACMTENNVPAVGKDQVRKGREMHWLRMDRYFVGSEDEPAVVHQPMACGQCEQAPCENVCPVQATAHSPDGINDMAYNRCIGTRYCSNNCPFKVRRFNFFNYASSSSAWQGLKIRNDKIVDVENEDQLLFMTRNPDVSVRFRGVMEKCNYCYQRVNRGKVDAKLAANERDAELVIANIKPACQQVCSSDCITFGDKNNPKSEVSKARSNPRNYQLLTELNLHTRTSYLGKVRNPSPHMKG